jgi:NAD(P)-dependent dehydrogenase (short-subunit alcohol dehydrogenase family)
MGKGVGKMSLENRVAVINGATGGLGSVLARDLAALHLRLALLDIDRDKLDGLVIELDMPEKNLFTRVVNLLDLNEAKSAADAVAKKFGQVDILLHVVGGWTGGKTLVEAAPEDLKFMLDQHVWTSFHAVQAFVPHLVRNGWGRIVMITSPFAAHPNAKGGPYAIGKSGQEALMLTLSQELHGTGVTANLLQAQTIDIKREKISSPSPKNASWSTPEEIAAAVRFLLSEEAGMVNGAKIPLFGSFN